MPLSKQESGETITGTACVNRWPLPAKAYVVHFDAGFNTKTKSNRLMCLFACEIRVAYF